MIVLGWALCMLYTEFNKARYGSILFNRSISIWYLNMVHHIFITTSAKYSNDPCCWLIKTKQCQYQHEMSSDMPLTEQTVWAC